MKGIKKTVLLSVLTIYMASLISSCGVSGINSHRRLYDGIMRHNVEMVKEGLEDGDNINKIKIVGVINKNPLSCAFDENQGKIAEYLIEKGADTNYTDKNQISLLMAKAYNTDVYFCNLLLKHGAKINKTDKKGDTALEYALRARSKASDEEGIDRLVTLLLNNGVKIRPISLETVLRGDDGNGFCRYELVRRILEGLLKEGYKSGLDSVKEAAILGQSSKVNELIKEGKMKKEDEEQVLFNTVAFGKLETLELLSDKGVDLNSRDKYNNTLVITASKYGQVAMVDYLLNKGVAIEAQNIDSDKALMVAVRNDKYEVAKHMIDRGADVKPYEHVPSPKDVLSQAAINGNINMMKLLIANGYPMSSNNIAESFVLAALSNHIDVMKYLLNNGADIDMVYNGSTALENCGKGENLETIKFLVENGAKINGKKDMGGPLNDAVSFGNIEVVKYLIEKGANVNAVATANGEKSGVRTDSALMKAIMSGYLDIVKLLVENGADLEYQDQQVDNQTAVITAAGDESRNILEYIIKKGAKINYQDQNGQTALMFAVDHQQLDNVKLLIKYKADITLKNKNGLTALDIAKKYKSKHKLDIISPNNDSIKILKKAK